MTRMNTVLFNHSWYTACFTKYKQTVWLFRPSIRKFLFVESGILGFGTRNPAQGFQNLANNWNPESKSYWQRIRNPCSTWNPESKTVLDYLTWGEVLKVVRFLWYPHTLSPNSSPCTSYGTHKENLCKNLRVLHLLIILFFLMIFAFDWTALR